MRLAGAFLWDGALVCPLCVVPVPYTCQTLTLRRNPQLRMMSLSLGLGDPAVPLSALLNMGAVAVMVVCTEVSIETQPPSMILCALLMMSSLLHRI